MSRLNFPETSEKLFDSFRGITNSLWNIGAEAEETGAEELFSNSN